MKMKKVVVVFGPLRDSFISQASSIIHFSSPMTANSDWIASVLTHYCYYYSFNYANYSFFAQFSLTLKVTNGQRCQKFLFVSPTSPRVKHTLIRNSRNN